MRNNGITITMMDHGSKSTILWNLKNKLWWTAIKWIYIHFIFNGKQSSIKLLLNSIHVHYQMLHFTVQLHSHCSFLWWWHMYFSYTNLLISRLTWNWNWENLVDINNINLLPKICKKFVFVLETVYWKIWGHYWLLNI